MGDVYKRQVHIRPACPPLLYGCKYLNFSRSSSEMDLITRRVIQDMEGTDKYPNLEVYADPESDQYQEMIRRICSQLKFTTLRYHRLDDMIESNFRVANSKEYLLQELWQKDREYYFLTNRQEH